MTPVDYFATLNFDILDEIANRSPTPARLGMVNKQWNAWWPHYIASKAPLLSQFVQNLLQSSFSVDETKKHLEKFPNTSTTITFDLFVTYNTVCLNNLKCVAKKFPNAISLYYQRPVGIEPQSKDLSGTLVAAKFVTNALCTVGRALPCIKAIGKKVQKAAEETIRDCAKDIVLEKVRKFFPKIAKLHIHTISWNSVPQSVRIRTITSLPLFPELEKISISSNFRYPTHGTLDFSSLIPESYTVFSQYPKLQSLDLENCTVSYDKNTYDQFQDKTMHKTFLHLPENISILGTKLTSNEDLLYILERCKRLTSLSLTHGVYYPLFYAFPNVPYTTLTHLKLSNFSFQNQLQQMFSAFPNLVDLNIIDLETFRDMGGGISTLSLEGFASSTSLQSLNLTLQRRIFFTNFICKETFPNLKTLTLSCLEVPVEIPDDLEIVQHTTSYDANALKHSSYVFRVT